MFRELLVREFAPYGSLTDEQIDALESHYNLLIQWNARLNLTRIESVEDAVKLHYCESLFVGTKLPGGPLRIVDVGSGAGFPGVPIAILRPECLITLVESHKRKGVFLREASRNLKNVAVITDRAENLQPNFDWVVSRAVSPKDVLKFKLAKNFGALVGTADVSKFDSEQAVPWGAGRHLAFHVELS
jgi:16S rRNA (guanine(527)-N(7))-methyltransferase RsmG